VPFKICLNKSPVFFFGEIILNHLTTWQFSVIKNFLGPEWPRPSDCINLNRHSPFFIKIRNFVASNQFFLKRKFWQFGKENFDSSERRILTVLKGKFWQFEKWNFDSLKNEILTVWKGKFDSLKKEILTVWKRKILSVWKRKF
jgi:hypothetical protein